MCRLRRLGIGPSRFEAGVNLIILGKLQERLAGRAIADGVGKPAALGRHRTARFR